MFHIRIEPLLYCCEQWKRQLAIFDRQIEEMEDIIKHLSALSGMDKMVSQCRKKKQQLEEEQKKYKEMMICLEKTVLLYRSCENRICENGEKGEE